MWNDIILDNTPPEAGCSWPVDETCLVENELTVQMAIDIIWAASGRQFGICVSTYRPCARGCVIGPVEDAWDKIGRGRFSATTTWSGSLWALLGCGCHSDPCSCTRIESFDLWHRHVRQVTDVTIDGVTLDPSAYRLSRNRLIRTDGGTWPLCQDMTVGNGAVGSWSVTVVHGIPVPAGGRVAAGLYACELEKALSGDEECALPRRIQTMTRAGVTVAFVDPMTFLDKGRTGLPEVDAWLQSVNPNSLQRGARVYRHDDPLRARRSRV